ncbi:MAG: hypothetical protein D6706_16870 [Chloroflexi bacterium]|nr:MAG: hypothetical protein D6706_16870 [Chloroflexota bacterium]
MNNQIIDSTFWEQTGLKEWWQACQPLLQRPFPPPASTSSSHSSYNLSHLSNWVLICEELLDTQHPPDYLRSCYAELKKRGKTETEIKQMREFAWMTAGWLNYAQMLWEWVNLDAADIRLAIEQQSRKGLITANQQQSMLAFLDYHK